MRDKVLIVDDIELNREMLSVILEQDYSIVEAQDGQCALELLRIHNDEFAVVLLDLIMPNIDGYKVLRIMNEKGWLSKIPVLVISGESAIAAEKYCFELGVSDFIRKPFDNAVVKNRVKNIVDLFQYKNSLEEKVENQTETMQHQYDLLQVQAAKLQESNERIIDILGTVVESRDLESGEHIMRVKGFTKLLATQLMRDYPEYGLTKELIEVITSASALHDIGKIAIPDSILLKPAKLTSDEYEFMKSHTTRGCLILENIEGVWNDLYAKVSYDICRYHHERYDGGGYPDKLAGEDIPISAQIVGIADVYDALVSERVYKAAYSEEEAFHMIVTGECGLFSPKLLQGFCKVRKEFAELAACNKSKEESSET